MIFVVVVLPPILKYRFLIIPFIVSVIVVALWVVLGSEWQCGAVLANADKYKRKSCAAHVTEVL